MNQSSIVMAVSLVCLSALSGCGGGEFAGEPVVDPGANGGSKPLSETERTALEQEAQRLAQKIAELEQQLAQANQENESLRAELAAAKEALRQAEQALAEGELAAAEQALAEANQALDALRAAYAALPGALVLDAQFAFGAAQDFQLDTAYPLASGATVQFAEVRYWLSNVKLTDAGGDVFVVPDAYYLVEVMKQQTLSNGAAQSTVIPANRRERVVIPAIPSGSYRAIEFAVGVDAAHNDNLSLGGGELHVLKNMTADNNWMWFTSYLFSKVRGSVTAPDAAPAVLSWDTASNDNYRVVQKSFAAPIAIGGGHDAAVVLRTDVARLFEGLDPVAQSEIGAGQAAERTQLADNWAEAFELVSAGAVVEP